MVGKSRVPDMSTRASAKLGRAGPRLDTWLTRELHGQLPCDGQTPESIESWMGSHGAAGTIVVVRHRQLGICEYFLDEVRRCDQHLKRVYLADHGTFAFRGDYAARPRRHFSLLAPISEVLIAAMEGHSWANGRPAFQRPLSRHERLLADIVRRQQAERRQ
jgi:hypothetical protein